jgi:pimeloyl-ACP methyl ester carboxylesterase
MRALKLMLLPLLLLAATYLLFDYAFPAQFTAAALGAERAAAGLQRKEVDAGGVHMVYLEGGQGPALLLVHGFGADKDNWTRVAKYLTPHYRVIAPDLPGFGESAHQPAERSRVEDQVAYLAQFAAALGLKHFDLGGNSMGGWISAEYAAAHPEQVDSLWLLDPAGVSSAKPSELIGIVRGGGRVPLIARSPEQYRELMSFVFVHTPFVPHAVLAELAQHQQDNADFAQKVFEQLAVDAPLEPLVKGLATPAYIVWGDHDRAVDPSGAEVLHGLMPNSRVNIMPDMGHLPMLEAPKRTALDYLAFRGSLAAAVKQ